MGWRRGCISGMCLVACVLALAAGAAWAQGKPEDSVVVYSAADADMVNSVVAAFEKKYPGIKVSTVVAGTGEIIKRIEAEKERPLGDVGWSFGPEAIGDKKALFEPYLSKESGNFFPGQVPTDRVWTPFTTMPYVIMYNKKLVSEAEKPSPDHPTRCSSPGSPSMGRTTPAGSSSRISSASARSCRSPA
jgi:ABC-type glycerol-3-phosphate transport system substrate-binding protein